MNVRELKNCEQGWCWQSKEVMRLIRTVYKSKKDTASSKRLTTALAIYQCLTEIASNNQKDSFYAYYWYIAELCGKSKSTVKKYLKEFIELGILNYENVKDGQRNCANNWILLDYSVKDINHTSVNNNSYTSVDNNYLQKEERLLEDSNYCINRARIEKIVEGMPWLNDLK